MKYIFILLPLLLCSKLLAQHEYNFFVPGLAAVPSGYFGTVALNDGYYYSFINKVQPGQNGCSKMRILKVDPLANFVDSILVDRYCDDSLYTYYATQAVTDGDNVYLFEVLHGPGDVHYGSQLVKYSPANNWQPQILVKLPGDVNSSYHSLDMLDMFMFKDEKIIYLNELLSPSYRTYLYDIDKNELMKLNKGVVLNKGYKSDRYYFIGDRIFTFDPHIREMQEVSKYSWAGYGTYYAAVKDGEVFLWGRKFQVINDPTNPNSWLEAKRFRFNATFDQLTATEFYARAACDLPASKYDDLAQAGNDRITAAFYGRGEEGFKCQATTKDKSDNYYGILITDMHYNNCDTILFRDGLTEINIKQTLNDTMIAIGGVRVKKDADGEYRKYDWVRFINIADKCSNVASSHSAIAGNELTVFPNPASSTIRVSGGTAVESVIIYDSLGKPIIRSTSAEVDISALTSGVYFVKCAIAGKPGTLTGKFSKG